MRFVTATLPFVCRVGVLVDPVWSLFISSGRSVRVQPAIRSSFSWNRHHPIRMQRKSFFVKSFDRPTGATAANRKSSGYPSNRQPDGEEDSNGTLMRLKNYEDNEVQNLAIRDDSLVTLQISRAMQQLGHGSPENHPAHPAIKTALAEGRVKPQFHALFLPETFLHNRLSFKTVTAGHHDKNRKLKLDFYAENLDKVVNKRGSGAGTICDEGIGKLPWKFDGREAAFAVELVNTDAEMLGEGIECTKLSSIPTEINPRDKSCELLTRPESRGVVADIFRRFAVEADDGGSVAAITGSPGIGKSWTLLYALQQALLYDGATVLFFFQKRDKAVLYLRRNNKIYAWTSTSKQSADSCLFMKLDVLVLLDPRDSGQGGADFIQGEVKLMYAASNNKDHFKGPAKKNNGNMEAYLGPPCNKELHVILARLDPHLKQDVIEERKKRIGNLIRYILDETDYIERLKNTNKALIDCAHDSELMVRAVWAKGMSDGKITIPGTLFQLLPTRPSELSNTIGYDGQNIQYRKPVALAINEDVRHAILQAGRYVMLYYWGIVGGAEYTRLGMEAKKLFINDLTNPDGLVLKRYLKTTEENTKWKESGELVVESGMLAKKGGKIDEMFTAVLNHPNIIVASEVAHGDLQIDAAGPGRKIYHITVSDGPSMSFKAMEQLCKMAGFIDDHGNIVPENAVEKLDFYWVTPERLTLSYQDHPSYLLAKDNEDGNQELVKKCLEIHVHQYILPMTNNSPLTFFQWKTNPPRVW